MYRDMHSIQINIVKMNATHPTGFITRQTGFKTRQTSFILALTVHYEALSEREKVGGETSIL